MTEQKTWILAGHIFDSQNAQMLGAHVIELESSCIKSLNPTYEDGASIAEQARFAGAQFINLQDYYVLPGLIDAHVHLGMDPNLSIDQLFLHGGFGTITLRTLKHAQANLLAGFTTVRDECSFAYTDVDVRDAINHGQAWGSRMFVSGLCLSATGGHADMTYRPGISEVRFPEAHIAYIVNGAQQATKAARTLVKHGVNNIKMMATGGVLSHDANPGAEDLALEEMAAAVAIANAHGLITSAHAHGAEGIKNALRAGVQTIEHGTLIDQAGIDLLVNRGAYVVPTIIAHQSTICAGREGRLPAAYVKKAELVMEGVHWGLRALREAGANIAFGTDAGTSGNSHGHQFGEFKLMMEEAGMSAAEVVRAATYTNACLLKQEGVLGEIAPGCAADIIATNMNPLENINHLSDLDFVMKDGRVYKKDGKPCVQGLTLS